MRPDEQEDARAEKEAIEAEKALKAAQAAEEAVVAEKANQAEVEAGYADHERGCSGCFICNMTAVYEREGSFDDGRCAPEYSEGYDGWERCQSHIESYSPTGSDKEPRTMQVASLYDEETTKILKELAQSAASGEGASGATGGSAAAGVAGCSDH